jgi:steroid 5-alpha reductase family enzyme
MLHPVLLLILLAWSLVAALQCGLWLVAQRTKNAGIVDVGWASSFAVVIAVFAWRAHTPLASFAPMAVVVLAWSLRLSAYLISRGAASGPEEGRYLELRQRWAPHAERSFFVFFQAQAALTAVLSLSIVTPFVTTPSLDALRWVGTAVSVIGIIGESIADRQLDRFRRANAGQRKVCDIGLWRYSRHPNYFFEWLVWVGYAVHCLAFPGGWIALSGQAIIFASIWKVTGIPATEAQALRSRGEAYREYQARTSAFVPWPPKAQSSVP